MARRVLAALLGLLAAGCAVLALTVSPLWLLAAGPAVVGCAAVGLGLDLDRFLRAVDGAVDGGDAGSGPAGLHP